MCEIAHGAERGHASAALRRGRLAREDLVRTARRSGEEQQQPTVEFGLKLGVANNALDYHRAVSPKTHEIETAKGSRVLILIPNRSVEYPDLDLAGLSRKAPWSDSLTANRVQGIQQAHGKAAARAQAGARGHIATDRDR